MTSRFLGGICTKGLSLEPRPGNNPGRIIETPAGMLNAIGLENVGIDSFITEKLPQLEPYETHVIANILGKSIDEFVAMTEKAESPATRSAPTRSISPVPTWPAEAYSSARTRQWRQRLQKL